MGNLSIKIAGRTLAQPQWLLHFFVKHVSRPDHGLNLHHGDKGHCGVRGQKHAPLTLTGKAAPVPFDIPGRVVAHHHLTIPGLALMVRYDVVSLVQGRDEGLAFTGFPWVSILPLIWAHSTHPMEGALFNRPGWLGRILCYQPHYRSAHNAPEIRD